MWRRRGEAAVLGNNAGAGFALLTAWAENEYLAERVTKHEFKVEAHKQKLMMIPHDSRA